MDFFDDLGKKIGETTKIVEDKSKEIIETARINIEIGREEALIKKMYGKIGELVYKAYSENHEFGEDIKKLCDEIDSHKSKIEELKAKAEEIKLKGK